MVTTSQIMNPVSALDISGIKQSKRGDFIRLHLCPWCGADAWSGRFHSQCLNEHCETQVAAPIDVVARSCGGDYDAAVAKAATLAGRHVGSVRLDAQLNKARRRVMDFWLGCCRASKTMEELQIMERLKRSGMTVQLSKYSRTSMNRAKLQLLIKMAEETGASIPLGLESNLPEVAMVSCVQSMPHTIDRLIIEPGGKTVHELVWNPRRGGATGLIGLSYLQPRYLAPDRETAARLQFSLTAAGRGAEVASVFLDQRLAATAQPWYTESHMLTLAVEADDDVIRVQQWLDCFPSIEQNMRAIWRSRIPGPSLQPGSEKTWSNIKFSSVVVAVGSARHDLPSNAVRIIEQTGARRADIGQLITNYEAEGRIRIISALRALAENRIIAADKGTTIRESSNSYTIENSGGLQPIANFVIHLQNAVTFPERSDMFFQCRIHCGKATASALIPEDAVMSVNSLQSAVRTQMMALTTPYDNSAPPTVINSDMMRRYVLHYLRGQVARLDSVEGVCRVGWSDDRTTFYTPGAVVNLNGTTVRPTPLHPGVTTLRCFAPVSDWSFTCPDDLPPACRDIIAMLLALTVRSYKRWLPRPAVVAQSSDAVDLLRGLMKAVGQTSVFELSHNIRDSGNIDGVKGYPFVASGYGKAQVSGARVPYMLLAEEGYHVSAHVDASQLSEAGRALQFGLLRVVEWCLATGADDFAESASMDFNTSLMREGRWLMNNVCELQSWEVSARGIDKLEELFLQIPVADTAGRLTLMDGVTLTADIRGLKWEPTPLRSELEKIDATLNEDAQTITAAGASLLPALSKFYGCEPKLTNVLTDLS